MPKDLLRKEWFRSVLWVVGSALAVPFIFKGVVPGTHAFVVWLKTPTPVRAASEPPVSIAPLGSRAPVYPSPPPAPWVPSEERSPGRYISGKIGAVGQSGASGIAANNGSRPQVVHLCAYDAEGNLKRATSAMVPPSRTVELILEGARDVAVYSMETAETEEDRLSYAVPQQTRTLAIARLR